MNRALGHLKHDRVIAATFVEGKMLRSNVTQINVSGTGAIVGTGMNVALRVNVHECRTCAAGGAHAGKITCAINQIAHHELNIVFAKGEMLSHMLNSLPHENEVFLRSDSIALLH